MQTFKTVIFISCIMGAVRSMAGVALVKNSLKKQLLAIIGLMTILCTVTALLGEDMELSLSMPELQSDDEMILQTDDMMLAAAEKEYEEYFMEKLNTNGISTASVQVMMDMNNEGEVYVYSVTAGLSDISFSQGAEDLIRQDLPECLILTVQSNEA